MNRNLTFVFSAYQNQNVVQDNKLLKVRAGTKFSNKNGLTVSAVKVNFHPSYDPVSLDNNLAILKLKFSLNYKGKVKNIMRISYGKNEHTVQRNLHKIIMLGWGDKVRPQFTEFIFRPL